MKSRWLLTFAALTMVGCGREGAVRRSHAEAYDTAMADYQAGRLEAAVEGFKKAVKDDPVDAGARFQLACLLQDGVRDFIGAYCAYKEYLTLAPSSDKAKVAKERMTVCEREMAAVLADRYSLTDTSSLRRELEEVKAQLKLATDRSRGLEDDLAGSIRRSLALKNENAKLMAAIREIGGGEASKNRKVKDVRAILEEDEEDDDRLANSADIAALRIEGAKEDGLPPLNAADDGERKTPASAPDATAVKSPAEKERKPAEPLHEDRPEEYVVQDGETLSAIAMRFYGTRSAWKRIRDANKATISVDGRVISGQRIRLP